MFKRYDKSEIEPFAISVIAQSFDSKYAEYIRPKDTDNFDLVSPDGKRAVEVVLVAPENEMNAYVYEKTIDNPNSPESKKEATKRKIKQAVFDEDGKPRRYYGGSIQEIVKEIKKRATEKNEKAHKRKNFEMYESVDLCVCVQDGALLDILSFQIADFDFKELVFDNIFFITTERFLRYSADNGFEEYQRNITQR